MQYKTIRTLAVLGGLLFAVVSWGASDGQYCDTLAGSSAPAATAQAHFSFDGPEFSEQQQARLELGQWLSESLGAPARATIEVPLTHQDRIDLGLENCVGCEPLVTDPRRKRVGVSKDVSHAVDFSRLPPAAVARGSAEFAGGELRSTPSGMGWSITLSSADAHALRVLIRDVHLPDDAALFIHNERGEAFGPYVPAGRGGEIWSNTVTGDHLTVVAHFFGDRGVARINQARFNLAEVVHLGPDFSLAAAINPDLRSGNGHCSYNESCVEDASCYGSNDFAHIDDARYGVGHMLFTSGPWAYVCSGGLMADTQASGTPYFITANHCISKGGEASSLEAYFQYMTDSCGASCPTRGEFPRTLGSSILSTDQTSDYTLLLLDQQPPSGSVFLGWTSSEVAFTGGHELYRISHPSGAPQAYSSHVVDTATGTCRSWPRGPWIYSDDVIGATEGGSSGSPVLNANGQVVGQLSGACGYNVGDVCDSDSNATVDGALAHYFDQVAQWLDPDGSGDPDPGDPDPGDPEPTGSMSVASIELSVRARGPWRSGQAVVTIVDGSGNPVGSATVTGTFSGDVSGTDSAATSGNGQALLESGRVRQNSINFSFCVDNVAHPDFDYDAGANAVTCSSN